MVTAVVAVTELVVTGKKTATASAGTVTLAGTVTEGESEMSVTTAPPASAAALKTTVPVAEAPPTTFCVVRETKERVGTGRRRHRERGALRRAQCGRDRGGGGRRHRAGGHRERRAGGAGGDGDAGRHGHGGSSCRRGSRPARPRAPWSSAPRSLSPRCRPPRWRWSPSPRRATASYPRGRR